MRKAFFQLHIAVFLAGFTGILGRLISMNEALIVFYRLLFTCLTMWVLFLLLKKIQKIPFTLILQIAGVGVIAALHWLCFYGSIKYANVSVGLVCFAAIGFFTALFEPLILRRRINTLELILGLITIAGIYVIFRFDSQYKTGIIIGIISSVFASLFPIFNRELLKKVNVETLLSWQQSGGLLAMCLILPVYLYYFPSSQIIPGWADFGWLLFLSWMCSVVAFQFSANALKRLSAFTVNLSFNLEPVYGIILAFILFRENEYLSEWFYIGVAIITIALIIHLFMLRQEERKLSSDAAK